MSDALPVLCDERGDRCCGTPACLNAGRWTTDPYDQPIGVFEGTRWHMHAEPICADPDCVTYLTRSQMATMRARQSRPIPPAKTSIDATEETER